jgi:hypothetical protein
MAATTNMKSTTDREPPRSRKATYRRLIGAPSARWRRAFSLSTVPPARPERAVGLRAGAGARRWPLT